METKVNIQILILGAGLFADDVADMVAMIPGTEIAGYIEGIDREKCTTLKNGKKIFWIDETGSMRDSCLCICAIGSPKRKEIIQKLNDKGFSFTRIIHPSAQLFPSASVGEGSIIGAGSVLAAGASVGKQVIINRGCLIGHHTRIDDFVTISPGVNIAGKVTVGEGTFIGMGAIVHDGIQIGKRSVIGSGSLVTRDVPDGVQVMGIPARITKNIED